MKRRGLSMNQSKEKAGLEQGLRNYIELRMTPGVKLRAKKEVYSK